MSSLTDWIKEHPRAYYQERLIGDVSEQVCTVLEQSLLTKKDLADALGSSKSNITQLLSGSRNMTLRTLSDIAHVLGMRVVIKLESPTQETKVTRRWMDHGSLNNGRCPYALEWNGPCCRLPEGHDGEHKTDGQP